jgi:non-heme chloroperoxidase
MEAHLDGFDSLDHAVDAVGRYLSHRDKVPDREGLRRNLHRGDDGRWRWRWDPRILRIPIDIQIGGRTMDAAARRIRVPVLLVRGEHSDVVADDDVVYFRSLVPQTDVAAVPGAHHMVSGDRNDAFAEVIVSYLDRHHSFE